MTSATKKKARQTIRSTDRGGPVLLTAGLLLLAFSLMLFLGATLQTSSPALNLLKRITIGLGGGLFMLVPILLAWLGILLAISSKRYASIYAWLISGLLVLCVGALMTMTLRVNDQTYPRLMDYIKNINSIRGAPYPDSLGEYMNAAFLRYSGLRSDNGIYPGGGALSMLIAYPLYVSLGNAGGIAVLVILTIALLFALFRVSPVRLVSLISDKMNSATAKPAVAGKPATAMEGSARQQVYPEDEPQSVSDEQTPQWPAYQGDESGLVYAHQPEPYSGYHDQSTTQQTAFWPAAPQAVEPGFVSQQSADQIYDEAQQPAVPPYRQQQANNAEPWFASHATKSKIPQSSEGNENIPVNDREHQVNENTWFRPAYQQTDKPATDAARSDGSADFRETPASASNGTPEGSEVQPVATGRRAKRTLESATQAPTTTPTETNTRKVPAAQEASSSATATSGKVQNQVNEKPAKPVGVQPAVPLSGERVAVQKQPVSGQARTLDNMVRQPVATQIRIALDDYTTPPLRLLTEVPDGEEADTTEEDRARAEKLIETLRSFSITAHLHDIVHGPTVTRFAIRLAEGINVNKLRNVMDNLTIELKAKGDIRAEMPIPGTSFVGLEVSNDKTSKVFLRDVLSSSRMMENKSPTAVALGKDITGTPIICELMDMPHLLIAGATGSGKSVCINSIICSMLYRASPRNVRLIMVDPKFVELQPYNDVPHLMMPVISDAKKATAALDWVCQEMDRRYQVLVDAGVRNLDAYNKRLGPDEEPLPRIIVIVDEMADLMTTSGKMIEDHIKRITAKARAAGICLILATQRPSVNIITGVIKANIPGRIAFRVSSPFDSKTILDSQGAEKLLGYGDMLYRSQIREPIRVQGCFVTDHDVEQTVDYIRSRNKADYNLDLIEHVEQSDQAENGNGAAGDPMEGGDAEFDELLPQAIEMAVESGQTSISMLQRVLRVGYARSGRLIDEMARRGIISGNEGTKARKTLMTREQYQSYLEQEL